MCDGVRKGLGIWRIFLLIMKLIAVALPARLKERGELIKVGQLSARVGSVVRGGLRL
jgi:hypothetical protein